MYDNKISSTPELVPQAWYNFLADYPHFLNEGMLPAQKVTASLRNVSVSPKQPLTLMKQSNNNIDKFISIPEELRELYLAYRPTPLRRAQRLEKALQVNAKIYYKFEGGNISGSHKLNTALAQAYYSKKAGIKHLITGTGAGQWGTAIAYACKLFGLECTVFMVGSSLLQKPQRRTIMEQFGATVISSPSDLTEVGKSSRKHDTQLIGTLATATGEAIELSNKTKNASFAVGSGENCVLLHQTIIGLEAINQMSVMNEFPDYAIACMGTGSNLAGIGLPLINAAQENNTPFRLIAAEPVGCPKLTRGKYAYDINDFSGITPISKMYTLGHKYIAPSIHAAGLRYHGSAGLISSAYANKLFDAVAIPQTKALAAGLLFAEQEGILPAPESAHAISAAIDLMRQNNSDKPLTILINISGHGLFDLSAYEEFRKGTVKDEFPDEDKLRASLTALEQINAEFQLEEEVGS